MPGSYNISDWHIHSEYSYHARFEGVPYSADALCAVLSEDRPEAADIRELLKREI